ncbi:MAG: fibronectin type III domain-containing protein [SAR202 cluster bacterium]|nr:fibronectin type III domain-containing protein [SAR202 cluster bacterium]
MPAQVASYLKTNAYPRNSVPNNTWGHGLARLPSLVPGAPANVIAAPGASQASVSWSAPTADGGSSITQYRVTSDPDGKTATVSGAFSSTLITGLTNGTPYTFTVEAANAIGTSTASTASNSVTPVTIPDPPTNVMATSTNAQATVTWTAPASDGGSPILFNTVTSAPSSHMQRLRPPTPPQRSPD